MFVMLTTLKRTTVITFEIVMSHFVVSSCTRLHVAGLYSNADHTLEINTKHNLLSNRYRWKLNSTPTCKHTE